MITRAKLNEVLALADIHPMASVVADEVYAQPTLDTMAVFWQSYTRNLDVLGLNRYRAEVMDCDKFARIAWALFSIDYARTRFAEGQSGTSAGIAFGEFHYWTERGGAHAINFACIELALHFYEPQLAQEIQLTETDRASCYALMV